MSSTIARSVLAFVAITACTSGPVAGGTATAAATPWPAAPATAPCAASLPAGSPPLMVVYESGREGNGQFDVIAIAGLDATARARAVFTSQRPGTDLAILPPHPAYAVKGAVYFVDGFGTVFRMGLDGKQTVVTKFPIGLDQQEVSFAVSPDGCQLAASVLTEGFTSNGTPWMLQTMKAAAGGPAKLLHTWTSPNPPDSKSPGAFKNLVMVGWDSSGPIAVVGSGLRYANPLDNSMNYVANPDFLGGQVVHLAGDGTAGSTATPPKCNAAQVSSGGDITCFQAGSADAWNLSVVRSTGGTEADSVHIPVGEVHSSMGGLTCVVNFNFGVLFAGPCPGAYVAVGRDGLVAATWAVTPSTGVPATTAGLWRGPDGGSGTLPPFFHPEGWIDAHTIFGQHTSGLDDAALVRIGGAQPVLEDLGFAGTFVGALSA